MEISVYPYPQEVLGQLQIWHGEIEEAKEKIRQSKLGEKNPMYGKKHTEESKNKSSESHKKENLSKETLEKMRNSALGRTHSEETKQKMSTNNQKSKLVMVPLHHPSDVGYVQQPHLISPQYPNQFYQRHG